MARTLTLQFQGEESSFVFSKLERRKLYGSRRRVAMDSGGAPCKRASLTEDGRFLLQRGMSAQGYFTESGRWVPNSELVGLKDGVVVERVESTLKTTQMLVESDPQSVLDCRLTSVYMLEPAEVSPTLLGALEAGKTFTFPFNYRSDLHAETAYLVANKGGVFVLVGHDTTPQWLESAAPPPIIDDSDAGDDDELDFEMF